MLWFTHKYLLPIPFVAGGNKMHIYSVPDCPLLVRVWLYKTDPNMTNTSCKSTKNRSIKINKKHTVKPKIFTGKMFAQKNLRHLILLLCPLDKE